MRSFYQDRLGTNIGETQKRLMFSQDAESSRHDAEYRLVRLVTPLGTAFALTLVVALHAMRTLCAYQDAAEARVASLTERHTMYKTLAERWAPLAASSIQDSKGFPSPAGSPRRLQQE